MIRYYNISYLRYLHFCGGGSYIPIYGKDTKSKLVIVSNPTENPFDARVTICATMRATPFTWLILTHRMKSSLHVKISMFPQIESGAAFWCPYFKRTIVPL